MPDSNFEKNSTLNVEHNPVPENIVHNRIANFSFHKYDDIVKNPGVEDGINNGRFFNVMTSRLNLILGVNVRNYRLPRPRENKKKHRVK